MEIKYTIDAFTSLTSLINFIEAKNTKGAGARWFARYETYLEKSLSGAKQKRLVIISNQQSAISNQLSAGSYQQVCRLINAQ